MSEEPGAGRYERIVTDVARSVGSSWAERRAATAALLASDADRERAVRQLTDAFSHGRLTAGELEERTERALAARTYGDLDDTLEGLGGLDRRAPRQPAPGVVLGLATVLLAPFVLLGVFLLFASGLGDRALGLGLLGITGAPLYAVWRWWRPPGS